MTNFFKKERNFKKEREGMYFNINFFWKIAVCLMFLVTLVALFFGYRIFIQTNKEIVLERSNINGQFETIKKDRIEEVLKYFSARKQKSNEILNYPASISDPSL